MGKKRKPITTRTPPVPSDSHAEIADWITPGRDAGKMHPIVERLDDRELGVGSKARLRIRRAPTSVYTVTELTPNRSFTWETKSAGIKGVATHVIEPDGNGSKVTLSVDLLGVLAMLMSPIIRRPSEENVRMEAEGLKRRAEAPDVSVG